MNSFNPPPSPLPPAASPSYPPIHFHGKPSSATTSFPDFIFRALSLFLLFNSSKTTLSNYTHFPLKLSYPLNRRRFLNVSTMSFSPNQTHKFPHFQTPQSLSDWLKPRLPSESFAAWGVKPGTKNIHNLWIELSEGETSLADSVPPVRTVEVVIVRVIGNQGKILVESHQELSNGDVRNRSRPLSEKMKPGESVEAAVFRAVKEELGSIIKLQLGSFEIFDFSGSSSDIVRTIPGSYTKKVEERYSESYPGLPACYILHTMDAVVEGLPESEFCTEEVDEYDNSTGKGLADGAVLCKKHFWKWVDSNSL